MSRMGHGTFNKINKFVNLVRNAGETYLFLRDLSVFGGDLATYLPTVSVQHNGLLQESLFAFNLCLIFRNISMLIVTNM